MRTMKSTLPMLVSATLLTAGLMAAASQAQDGPLKKIGRALDNTGKNIRGRVEGEIARGEITAQERDLLARVDSRIRWDKQLVAAVLQIEVRADGTVVLRGSVPDESAKNRAADLAQSTVGVTRVVDELGVTDTVKIIDAKPGTVIESKPGTVIEIPPPVTSPAGSTVIIKP